MFDIQLYFNNFYNEFILEQNLQKDAIVEEFTLTSIGDNLIEIIPQAKTTSWFVYVIKALSHKIVLSVSAPNNSACSDWKMEYGTIIIISTVV